MKPPPMTCRGWESAVERGYLTAPLRASRRSELVSRSIEKRASRHCRLRNIAIFLLRARALARTRGSTTLPTTSHVRARANSDSSFRDRYALYESRNRIGFCSRKIARSFSSPRFNFRPAGRQSIRDGFEDRFVSHLALEIVRCY